MSIMDRNMLINLHKVKPPTFGNIQKKREVESSRLKDDRHARRTDRFNARRNMVNEEDSKSKTIKEVQKKNPAVEASKILDRKLALQKFKKEKEALLRASKKNVRPPFKVGIPHHGSSPLLRDLTNHDCLTNKHRPVNQEVRPQRVTRAMSKATNVRKENHLPIRTISKPIIKVAKDIKAFPFKEPKSVFTFKPKKVESVKKLTSPHTPTVLKRSARKTRTLLTNPSRRNEVFKSCLNKSTSSTSSGEMLAVPLPEVETDSVSPVQKEEPLSPSNASPQHSRKPNAIKCTQASSNEITEFVLSPDVETQRGKRLGRKRMPSEKMPLPESQSIEPDVQFPDAEFHCSRRNVVVKSSMNKSSSSTSSGEMLPVTLSDVETDGASSVLKEEPHSPPNTSPQHSQKETINKCAQAVNEIKEFVLSPDVETQREKRLSRKRAPSAKMPLPESQSTGPDVQNPDAEFHKNRLNDETRRLLSLAELWEPLALQPKIPREVIDEIDSLVGQTRLLTRDKFKQFRGLVDQFESGATTAASVHPITLDDLDGFWEMMYLQVEPLIKRYNKLEIMKTNNWKELKVPTPPRKRRRIAVKPKGTPRPSAALRAAMQARRTRTSQSTTVPVTQDLTKTPTTDRTSAVNSLLSSANQPSNSNSPYIVMRLSGMGKSIGRSTMVGVDTSDQSITCKSLTKSEVTSDAIGVLESQNSTIKPGATEIEGDKDFGINWIFELQSNVSEATFVNTPRRSVRLLGKTPTPMKSRLCAVCLSPKCDLKEHGKENLKKGLLIKSRKTCRFNLSPFEQKQIGDDTATALDTSEESEKATKPVGKRFALRPSNLVVSERITFSTKPEGSRRSVRISNARKVTFDAGTEEKRSFKLPATPYRKSGIHQSHEDSSDDD